MSALPKRALLTWELGDNFGHMAQIIKVGAGLRKAGVETFYALQNLGGVSRFITEMEGTILAAPHARIKPPADPHRQVLNYADDLVPCGYQNPHELAALIRAWDGLFRLIKPDVLITNSSPTALLAASPYRMLSVNIGVGYEVPQLATPMPPLRYWEESDTATLAAHEANVMAVIAEACQIVGVASPAHMQDILRTDLSFIAAFPEFDHYPSRKGGDYIGPFFVESGGVEVAWQERVENKKRIFAYLSHGQDIGTVIKALHQLSHDIILVAPRLSPDNIKTLSSNPHLRVFTTPVKISAIAAGADLCITHGGSGTFIPFMLCGVPQIFFPNHIEQLMSVRRVVDAGLGIISAPRGNAAKVITAIDHVLNNPAITQKAREWADGHKGYSQQTGTDRVCAAILEKFAERAHLSASNS